MKTCREVLIKLGEFANINLSDVSEVNEFMVFKQIDTNQTVTIIDMNKAVALYRKMTKQLHHTNKIILSWFHFNLKKEIFVSSNFILAQPHKLAWTNTYIPF